MIVDDDEPVSGAGFAIAFAGRHPVDAEAQRALPAWFDLAIDVGRRAALQRVRYPFVVVTATDEQVGELSIRPEAITAIAQRPDATRILVDGQWLALVDEYNDVVSLVAAVQLALAEPVRSDADQVAVLIDRTAS